MLYNFFKSATRNLWHNKGTSIINIGGLAVGMTAAVLILLWVNNEINFDNYHTGNNKIYRLTARMERNNTAWETTPLLLADAIRKEIPGVEKAAILSVNHWPVFSINGNSFYQKNCAFVDEGWFDIFRYDFLEGDAASFNRHTNSIILTQSEATKYFGKMPAVGQTILVDKMAYAVRAVVADAPPNSSFQYSAFLKVATLLKDTLRKKNDEQWNNYNYITFVKTRPNTNSTTIGKKITGIMQQHGGEDGVAITLLSLKDMHFENEIFNSSFIHGNRNTVIVFGLLAFLLLLIACINYVNLTTAKASLRSKEVGIRKINGASRGQLFWQFIAESLLVSLLALLATLLLVYGCLPVFNQVAGRSFEWSLSSPVLWKTTGISLLAAMLLNSIYPALLLSSFKPMHVFRGAAMLSIKDVFFRKGLVVLQFTISVILIAGTIVMYSQLRFIQQSNPGYNRSELISFALPQISDSVKRAGLMKVMRQQLLSESSIEQVAASNQPVVNIGSVCAQCADWEGKDASYNPDITQLSADVDFYKTMQLQMAEGNWFSASGRQDQHEFILNQSAVREFNLAIPVTGTRFVFKGDTGRIVGVVKDFSYQSMHDKTGPVVVFNNPRWHNYFTVRIVPNGAQAAIAAISNFWNQHVPGTPLEYNFLTESFNQLYSEDQRTAKLVVTFAFIAILISALGLFSLAAFSIQQRSREIGIRKVLGASVVGIATMVSHQFLKLVIIGVLIACPIAWWAMHRWIEQFAYRISIGWWVFALAGSIALLIALATVSFQSVKAAIANPVKALRTEG